MNEKTIKILKVISIIGTITLSIISDKIAAENIRQAVVDEVTKQLEK